jgi:predicted phage tail protein
MNAFTVQYNIHVSKNQGGTWVKINPDAQLFITGKSRSRYQWSHYINLPADWTNITSVSVKITRVSDDNINAKKGNDLYWDSYTILQKHKLNYPNSAVVQMEYNAQVFSGIPKTAFEIKGLKVKVPSNYHPYDPGHCSSTESRSRNSCSNIGGLWTGTEVNDILYEGHWDGEFVTKWTCNPAWIFLDLCTNKRYGLGGWLEEHIIDKWGLYEIARYCDNVTDDGKFVGLPDGYGNYEARYSCNMYISQEMEAYKILKDIASVFRGLTYWEQGRITPKIDSPKNPVALFTESNVLMEDGNSPAFVYEGSGKDTRHNVIEVTWNNPDNFYAPTVERVEDVAGIAEARGQLIPKQLLAVGCTSKAMARRMGHWMLYTEKYETEVVTFQTGLQASNTRPGDVINIADSHRTNVRYGGRVSKVSTGSLAGHVIELDSTIDTVEGAAYTLSILHKESSCTSGGEIVLDSNSATITTQEACINNSSDNSWSPHTWVEKKVVAMGEDVGRNGTVIVPPLTYVPHTCTGLYDGQGDAVTWDGDAVDASASCLLLYEDDTASIGAIYTRAVELGTFTSPVKAGSVWVLEGAAEGTTQQFRVVNNTPKDGGQTFTITALKYHAEKYGYIERQETLELADSYSLAPSINSVVPEPTNLAITEELYEDSRGMIRNRVLFSWSAPTIPNTEILYPYVSHYYVEYRVLFIEDQNLTEDGLTITGVWQVLGNTSTTSISITEDIPEGQVVEFRVKTRRIY